VGKQIIDFQDLKMLLMDVDGVLTDGGLIVHSDGTESKQFHVFDGHRIKMWQRAGLLCGLLSGRQSASTTWRAKQLEIPIVLQDCKQKLPAFEQLLADTNLRPQQVVYVGDDLMDLPLLRRAGFAVTVADAVEEVKQQADYVTQRSGGQGAVGEVIEYLLKITGRWEELIQRYQV